MDYYGFPLNLTPAQAAARQRNEAAEAQLAAKWKRYADKGLLPRDDALKKLVRKGIPAEYRPRVWVAISGAAERRSSHAPDYYESLVELGQGSSTFLSQIELDLPRTFPSNVWTTTPEASAKLRRILVAFSMHAPSVGYCQGMNYLAAMLLLVLKADEVSAFWVLDSLLGEGGILYPESFSSNLLGTHVEMAVLAELLHKKLSKLSEHLKQMSCDISIISTDYFLCLYCTTMPSETAMRIWDSLLLEGPKVLYRVAIALLKENEAALLRIQDPGLVLRHMKTAAAGVHDRDALMEAAFSHVGSMPMARIVELRQAKHDVLQRELHQRSAKSNLRQAIQRGTAMHYVSSEGLAAEANKIRRERSLTHELTPDATPPARTPSKDYTPILEVRDVTRSARGQRAGFLSVAGSVVVPV